MRRRRHSPLVMSSSCSAILTFVTQAARSAREDAPSRMGSLACSVVWIASWSEGGDLPRHGRCRIGLELEILSPWLMPIGSAVDPVNFPVALNMKFTWILVSSNSQFFLTGIKIAVRLSR